MEKLIELHSKYLQMCLKVFANDAAFVAAVDKAFRTVVNDTATNSAARSPEVMARYTDTLLRKKQKTGLTEAEIEDRLTRVVRHYLLIGSRIMLFYPYFDSLPCMFVIGDSVQVYRRQGPVPEVLLPSIGEAIDL